MCVEQPVDVMCLNEQVRLLVVLSAECFSTTNAAGFCEVLTEQQLRNLHAALVTS